MSGIVLENINTVSFGIMHRYNIVTRKYNRNWIYDIYTLLFEEMIESLQFILNKSSIK